MKREEYFDKLRHRSPEEIHPAFKPRWKHTPTRAIRVPDAFADTLIEIARRLDDQTLGLDDLQEAIATKTEEIKRDIKAEIARNMKAINGEENV